MDGFTLDDLAFPVVGAVTGLEGFTLDGLAFPVPTSATAATGRRFSVAGRGSSAQSVPGRGTAGYAIPGSDGDES